MNYRLFENGIKFFLLISSAFLVADTVSIGARGYLQVIPTFTIPERVKKKVQPVLQQVSSARMGNVVDSDVLPPLVLLGTVSGAHPYAVILETTSKMQEIYRVNDEVNSGWFVTKIDKNRVVLKKKDREEILEIKFIETESVPMPGTGSLKQNTMLNSVRLSPLEVESAFADLNKVMTQARVIPHIIDGKTTGYKIFNIISDSIYSKIGLSNNDVIERVNGVEINSPDMFYRLFQQIRNENKVVLDLKRSEEKKSIMVEIR